MKLNSKLSFGVSAYSQQLQVRIPAKYKCFTGGSTVEWKSENWQNNQVQHLTKDTKWESGKNTVKHYKREQIWDIYNTNDAQKKNRLGTVNKNILLEGLNQFHGAILTISSDEDQDT